MTKNHDALAVADRPPLLEKALEKNEEVKERWRAVPMSFPLSTKQ